MKLLIDIGNTRVKWALANSQIIAQGEMHDVPGALAEHIESVRSIWVSCVGKPSTLASVAKQLKGLLSLELNLAKVTRCAGGLVNQYRDLDRLGVDRWIAAIGARARLPCGPFIVIDAGTAITIDYVDADDQYQGGVILPGFATMHDSLLGRTAGIQSQRQAVSGVIGKTTQECVNSGSQYGVLGAVERVVSEMQSQAGEPQAGEPQAGEPAVKLIITGGDAQLITRLSHLSLEYHANLLFEGLNMFSDESDSAANASINPL